MQSHCKYVIIGTICPNQKNIKINSVIGSIEIALDHLLLSMFLKSIKTQCALESLERFLLRVSPRQCLLVVMNKDLLQHTALVSVWLRHNYNNEKSILE